jgi:hypothetical protein
MSDLEQWNQWTILILRMPLPSSGSRPAMIKATHLPDLLSCRVRTTYPCHSGIASRTFANSSRRPQRKARYVQWNETNLEKAKDTFPAERRMRFRAVPIKSSNGAADAGSVGEEQHLTLTE